jgi:hypothetical protein
MADSPPASTPTPPTGGSGNGPLIGVAVALVAVMGGLLWYKSQSAEAPQPAATVSAPTQSARPPRPMLMDAPPPPPTTDDSAAPPPDDAGAAKPKTPGASGGGCSGSCNGNASGGTTGDIQGRAGAARGCYERALRQNSTLQGRMQVSLRVDPSGTICSASIAGDTVGSPDVSSCVLGMFRGQHVSPPTGGCVDLNVPLSFQPKNK